MGGIGIIYTLKHKTGTTVKVGMTHSDSQTRLTSYAKRYELEGFSWHRDFQVPADAARAVEKAAHKALEKYRLSGIVSAREIFSCGAKTAERAIEQAIAANRIVQECEKSKKEEQQKKHAFEVAFEEAFQKSDVYETYQDKMAAGKSLINRKIESFEIEGGLSKYARNPLYFLPALSVLFFIGMLVDSRLSLIYVIIYISYVGIAITDDPNRALRRKIIKIRERDRINTDQLFSDADKARQEFKEEYSRNLRI